MNTISVADIISIMEDFAPLYMAEDWDNVGLQIGSRTWPVEKIWVALDPSFHIVQEACKQGVDLLITHHPLFFKPLKTLDLDTLQGRLAAECIRHKLGIYSAHTNLDSVRGGLNDIFADRIGLHNCSIFEPSDPLKKIKLAITAPKTSENSVLNILSELECPQVRRFTGRLIYDSEKLVLPSGGKGTFPKDDIDNPAEVEESRFEVVIAEKKFGIAVSRLKKLPQSKGVDYEIYPIIDSDGNHGLGRVGDLPQPLSLEKLALTLKQQLKINSIRMVGDPALSASKVAICTGSGAGLLNKFITSEAQVYISGDIKYHEAMAVMDAGKGLIDVGHFASEQIMIDAVAERLKKWVPKFGLRPIVVEACRLERDPFSVL